MRDAPPDSTPGRLQGTPIRALGATDQHSQVQLYREGPDDKVFGIVALDAHDERLPIPKRNDADALQYLGGHDLADLLTAERRATEYAFAESKRPSYTITLPRLDAPSIGPVSYTHLTLPTKA